MTSGDSRLKGHGRWVTLGHSRVQTPSVTMQYVLQTVERQGQNTVGALAVMKVWWGKGWWGNSPSTKMPFYMDLFSITPLT